FAGAEGRLAELDAAAGALERRLRTLTAAYEAATASDRRQAAQERVHLRRKAIAEVRRHLKERDEATDALSAALGEAVKQYRRLIAASLAAAAACPTGAPEGSLTDPEQISRLTSAEIHRLD